MFPIDFFYRAAQLHADRSAIESPTERISYAELLKAVNALAVALQEKDPEPGSRVGLCAANSPNYIIGMLAILAAGKIWVPLNYRSTSSEIRRILDTTTPTALLVDETGDALIQGEQSLKIPFEQFPALINTHQGKQPVRHALSRDDTQAIKFTGGTTGIPKGVMQPYRAWVAGIINQIHGWQITHQDKFVICAPISHGTGTYVVPLLAQGGTLLLCASNSAQDIAHAFKQQGGTMTFMPPTLIYKLMAANDLDASSFPDLRLLIYGGAPMPVEKVIHTQAFFGPVVATTYGQTEAPQIATLLTPENLIDPNYRSSVGRATWLSEVGVMSPDGQLLPPGEKGEIVIKGDLVMAGYWQLPEKTQETVKNGWLHTGDVGYLDEQGFLYIKDRLREVIITGGFNVYPIDVENTLSLHPAVHEAAVFGVTDEKWGETVNAAIELKASRSVSEDELKSFVREKLGPVLTPKHIHFYDSLPRSSVGKVLKTAIKDQVGKTQSAQSVTAPAGATN
ncbi:class I adenylate-forming enzyme family protein [Pollutimonas harenae]|uniref:AMP-binding protein n=1 Tax=Pollutimonas harenae TaxID=657015 RepID=A0A853GR17_9BURK|nr:AMP-binding protein [Pollutimonas harenae]NYT84601.1 AMP-binding protein [Pollutimonas harenae]TEA73008.1 long-chain fatty acid--CoA ligase [Pollutimonas harenae]